MSQNKIYVVGFGPGEKKFMTGEAVCAIEKADFIIGYTTYTELLKKEFPEKEYISTPMRGEKERCRIAVEKALEGNTIALVSSGDSGIYGMAGIMFEISEAMSADVDIIPVAGVTAASSAASILGAPLMHDFAVISLSDLMTPLEQIYHRVSCASDGDFVICIYNPSSRSRKDYLKKTAEIIMKYRSADTPVGIVRNAGRENMTSRITVLGNLKNEETDMFCVVIVGNSQTYVKNGKMITPRGYKVEKKI